MGLYIFIFLINFLWASSPNEITVHESYGDSRGVLVIFSIKKSADSESIWLERRSGGEFYLKKLSSNKSFEIHKISSPDAKKLEKDFTALYFKINYELVSNPENCSAIYELNLKGDSSEICQLGDGKTQELFSFIKKLEEAHLL